MAYGGVKHSWSLSLGNQNQAASIPVSIASFGVVETGWTVGGGLEWAISDRVSLKGDYNYVTLGGTSFTSSNQAFCGFSTTVCSFNLKTSNTENHLARIGVNWKL